MFGPWGLVWHSPDGSVESLTFAVGALPIVCIVVPFFG